MLLVEKNNSLTVAPENARLNSLLSEAWANDTRVLVTDVPMLAPIMIGMAARIDKTAHKQWIREERLIQPSGMSPGALVTSVL